VKWWWTFGFRKESGIFLISWATISFSSNILYHEVSKPEGKRPLRRPRRWWEDNIRMDLREVVWEVEDWMHLPQDREERWVLVNTVTSLRIP
jgi:hypothetical protein